MKSHSILVAEDHAGDKEALLAHIGRYKNFRVDGSAADGAQALAALRSKAYDLVFLDIDIPVLSGFEVLKSCGLKVKPYVIITSSYPSFAVEAFDFMAVDFLLKPYSKSRFDKAADRYLAR